MLRHPAGIQIRRRFGACVMLGGLLLVGCAGGDRQAVIAPETSESAASRSGRAVDEAAPAIDWQPLPLNDQMNVWLPTTADWTLADRGKQPGRGSFIALENQAARVGLRVQSWLGGEQSAATLCAELLVQVASRYPGSPGSPQPLGNPSTDSDLLDVFSCEIAELDSPTGPLTQHVDVVVRKPDGITYTQLTSYPTAATDDPVTRAALDQAREAFWRTLSGLDQY